MNLDNLMERINKLENKLNELTKKPEYKFALREDLKDDLRFLPTRSEPFASGWDVRAAQLDRKPITIRAGQYFKIPLGFRSFCQDGWWYQLHPRSSSFAKKHMHCLIGVIDETWPNETCMAGMYLPDINSLSNDLIIKFGDAIGQIIPVKRQEMITVNIFNSEMDALLKNRNAPRVSGFGSTGD